MSEKNGLLLTAGLESSMKDETQLLPPAAPHQGMQDKRIIWGLTAVGAVLLTGVFFAHAVVPVAVTFTVLAAVFLGSFALVPLSRRIEASADASLERRGVVGRRLAHFKTAIFSTIAAPALAALAFAWAEIWITAFGSISVGAIVALATAPAAFAVLAAACWARFTKGGRA
ncbi:hypothetical protein GCM10022286_00500 [Gryllotalpicola daejeonensis]|uniref:Uncharacterized protein n=1 Tax=Gryllotalpicola daejeonensis TaxID=993087 RepID=A0ABP7ZCY6_9MICO